MANPYEEEDFSKYKYVIYARKSSEESDRQLRSLDDQIAECKQLSTRLGLEVVGKPIWEAKSAKKPNKRERFNQLLEDLKSGKIHGVIAWAPDRLARNMLEAGIIIDMVGEGIIKDLKFVTYPFSKDANGLMLLGMSFVLSKQFSDKLGQDVSRGQYARLGEGKAVSITKHGYYRDEDGYFRPNAVFGLLRTAWERRIRGESLIPIAKWLNESGYVKKYKKSKREVKMTKQILSRIFNDTFYFGKLKVKDTVIDLREFPEANFEPMVSELEFQMAREMARSRKQNYLRQRNKFGILPLKNIVRCAECGNACSVYPSKSKGGQRYLYYTCRKDTCSRFNEGTRGKVIFDWLYEFLKGGLEVNREDYNNLMKDRRKNVGTVKNRLEAEIRQLEIKIKGLNETIDNISIKLIDVDNNNVKTSLGKQVDDKKKELDALEAELEKKREQKRGSATVDITWDKFVNITKNIANKLKKGDKHQKDAIVRIMFVNILVNRDKVVNYSLKEPFMALLNRETTENVLPGRNY